jgi:hypothetical protein
MVFSKFFDNVASATATEASNKKQKNAASQGGSSEEATKVPQRSASSGKSGSSKSKNSSANRKSEDQPQHKSNSKKTPRPVTEHAKDGGKSSKGGLKPDRKRRHCNTDEGRGSTKVQRRSRPSPEALEVARQLMELSRRKKLTEAPALYWDDVNHQIRGAHHACIVVDCCDRCGDVSKAKAVLQAIPSKDITLSSYKQHSSKDTLSLGVCKRQNQAIPLDQFRVK